MSSLIPEKLKVEWIYTPKLYLFGGHLGLLFHVTVKKKAKKDERTPRCPKRYDRGENVMGFIYRPLSSTAQGASNVR
jgi:hypothetical protein